MGCVLEGGTDQKPVQILIANCVSKISRRDIPSSHLAVAQRQDDMDVHHCLSGQVALLAKDCLRVCCCCSWHCLSLHLSDLHEGKDLNFADIQA